MTVHNRRKIRCAVLLFPIMPRATLLVGICLLGCLLDIQTGLAAQSAGLQTMTPQADLTTPLMNPGMGLYLPDWLGIEKMPPEVWYTGVIAIGYYRRDWAEVELREGQYQFDEFFGPIWDLWVKQFGKRVAFRFMSQNTNSTLEYVSPKWIFDSGVPGVVQQGNHCQQVNPVFWDERYLQIQEQFIAALGKYLDGRPGLEFIDIGGIGEWGEQHLNRWTAEQLEATGYTEDKYIAACRRMIDIYVRAFPRTRIFINLDRIDAVNQYAMLKGVNLRQDGLGPNGGSYRCSERYFRPYARQRVVMNYEFGGTERSYLSRGIDPVKVVEAGLSDPISYLHLNILHPSPEETETPPELKESILNAARRIGFRFMLHGLHGNKVIQLDGQRPGRLVLEQAWKNVGVAPCYDSYALRWALVDRHNRLSVQQLYFPRVPTTQWWQGEEITLTDIMRVPSGLTPGKYRLKMAMVNPEEPGTTIQLGIAGRDAQGWYDLGEVEVKRVNESAERIREQLQCELSAWSLAKGMSGVVEVDPSTGEQVLVLTGTQPGTSWNYASLRLPIRPYSCYRLTCLMRVDTLEPADQLTAPAPQVKLEVQGSSGEFLGNTFSPSYHLSQEGTWQHLTLDAETAGEAAIGVIAIERGDLQRTLTATIRLKDIRLELFDGL